MERLTKAVAAIVLLAVLLFCLSILVGATIEIAKLVLS